jgi:hypothetical protein
MFLSDNTVHMPFICYSSDQAIPKQLCLPELPHRFILVPPCERCYLSRTLIARRLCHTVGHVLAMPWDLRFYHRSASLVSFLPTATLRNRPTPRHTGAFSALAGHHTATKSSTRPSAFMALSTRAHSTRPGEALRQLPANPHAASISSSHYS